MVDIGKVLEVDEMLGGEEILEVRSWADDDDFGDEVVVGESIHGKELLDLESLEIDNEVGDEEGSSNDKHIANDKTKCNPSPGLKEDNQMEWA